MEKLHIEMCLSLFFNIKEKFLRFLDLILFKLDKLKILIGKTPATGYTESSLKKYISFPLKNIILSLK